MSNAAKLKKKAAEFEQKRQFDKALELYVQVLEAGADGDAEPEVALYNRVGDLLLRAGSAGDAIGYYRKAVDLYVESGFLNNAIALCNKILRQDPTQTEVHYTLGRISAEKGFRSDAKFHFLEYAQQMQRVGALDEAFRALKEFADLCPEQDDIRLLLAEQLSKQGRSAEAVEQLQTLHAKLAADGRMTEARATVDRLAAIDPAAVPRSAGAPSPGRSGELVFLDVSWEEPPAAAPAAAHASPAAEPEAPAIVGASILDPAEPLPAAASVAAAPIAGFESTALDGHTVAAPPALELDPVPEPAGLDLDARPAHNDEFGLRDLAPLPELVPPAPALPAVELEPVAALPAVELPVLAPLEPPLGHPLDEPLDETPAGPALELIMPEELDAEADAAHGGLLVEHASAGAPIFDAPAGPPTAGPARVVLPLDAAPATGELPALAGLPLLDDAPGPTPAAGNSAAPETFVNLGDWLRDEEPPKSTRMVADAVEPGEGEEFDFDDMLRKFKRGVAENVDVDDHESHYDLGVAFREMGLVDEAIAEFQKALRGTERRVRTYEALGQCFVDKGQHQVAVGVLTRATAESPADDQLLVGVLYLLGLATEALGRSDEAVSYFQRVFAVDITFQDVEDRLSALERTTR